MARSWIASPVESNNVTSSTSGTSLGRSDEYLSQLGHVVALEDACLDRSSGLAAVARLLPVVAEDACAHELLRRDLGLAGPVRTHEGDVLPGPQRARAVEDAGPRRHGDHGVAPERLVEGARDLCAELVRHGAASHVVDVPHERRPSVCDEHANRLGSVHPAPHDGDRRGVVARERVRCEDAGRSGAQRRHRRGVENRLELPRLGVREDHQPCDGREAERRVAGEGRHPFQERVPSTDGRHRPEVPGRVVRHVHLRLHHPLAALVRDERVPDRRVRVLRRDGVEHGVAREDGDRHRASSRSPHGAHSALPALRRTHPRRTTGRGSGGSRPTTAAPRGPRDAKGPRAAHAGTPWSSA